MIVVVVRYQWHSKQNQCSSNLEAATFVVSTAIENVTDTIIVAQTDLDKQQLIDELANMIYKYLFLPDPLVTKLELKKPDHQ